MRARRIKANILSKDEVHATYAAMHALPRESEEWEQERAKLLESLYRLSKFIAVEKFLKAGRLSPLVEADDLAQEATERFASRIDTYDPTQGASFVTWCANYIELYYARVHTILANPISVPINHATALRSWDADKQREVADVLAGNRDDQPELRLGWLADGRNIVSLDDEQAMRVHTHQVWSDPTGAPEPLPYQELLTDYHRLGAGGSRQETNLWAGHGAADELTDPEYYADIMALQTAVRQIIDERLNEREAQAIGLRFGLEDGQPRTLEEVGEYLGVTRERVRQIEAKAISKLRWDDSELRAFLGHVAGHEWSLDNYVRRPVADGLPDYAAHEAAYTYVSPPGRAPAARRRFPPAIPESEWDW